VLRIVEAQRAFDLFVIDVGMPQMSGDELARRLRQMNSDAKVFYFTGYADLLCKEKTILWKDRGVH
jgi:CheY-like chemotaxis protein